MSDNISSRSLAVGRTVSKSAEDLNGVVAAMNQQANVLRSRINELENDLAHERKIKAGFKVIVNSFDSENKALKARILRKYRKHNERERHEKCNEYEMFPKDYAKHPREKNIPFARQDLPLGLKQEFAAQKFPTTCQTLSVENYGVHVSKDASIYSSLSKEFSENSLPFTNMLSLRNKYFTTSQEHPMNTYESKLLRVIESLSDNLKEAEQKLKDAVEKSEMMEIQMETYKSDFMSERSDRENAMGRIMELEKQLSFLKKRPSENHFKHESVHLPNTLDSYDSPSFSNVRYREPHSPLGHFFREDVLIARGDHLDHQTAAVPKYSSPKYWNHSKENVVLSIKSSKGDRRCPIDDRNLTGSSESLNLLPTEHGGDDYCQ